MAEYVVDLYTDHDGVKCERIVRCRDCRLHERHELVGSELHVCKRLDEYWHTTDPDGFCAWGERKEDEWAS